MMACILCGDEALARFKLPGGCIALPEAVDQPLCLHHIVRAQPLDGMYLVEDYTLDCDLTKAWESGKL